MNCTAALDNCVRIIRSTNIARLKECRLCWVSGVATEGRRKVDIDSVLTVHGSARRGRPRTDALRQKSWRVFGCGASDRWHNPKRPRVEQKYFDRRHARSSVGSFVLVRMNSWIAFLVELIDDPRASHEPTRTKTQASDPAIRNAAPLMDQPSSRGARVGNTPLAQRRSKQIPLLPA
jgi:hypothetical protein